MHPKRRFRKGGRTGNVSERTYEQLQIWALRTRGRVFYQGSFGIWKKFWVVSTDERYRLSELCRRNSVHVDRLAPAVWHNMITHIGGQGPSPHPGPLENSGGNLQIYPGLLHPPEPTATLLEEIHVNNWVIHQVLSDPRQVDQRGHIVEGELGSWADARQHQNLYTYVRLEGA